MDGKTTVLTIIIYEMIWRNIYDTLGKFIAKRW